MANQKISQMPSLTASELAAGDLLAVVDVSDVTQASSGSNKKITVTELQSAAVSAGTANGVLYLNGSKVATSGSALTFDGSKFEVVSSATAAAVTRLKGGNVTNGGAAFHVQKSTDSSTVFAVGDSSAITGGSPDVEATIYTGTNIPLRFYVNAAERARIDSSGNLLVGTTSSSSIAAGGVVLGNLSNAIGGAVSGGILTKSGVTTTSYVGLFSNPNGAVGSITVAGATTAYNTSSDYRLKTIAGPVTNSGAYIDSLNPVEGTWKADGSTFVGLIAHEVQEVSRTQVATGEKDGAEMQAMDYSNSELIANLIAEVKSLRARVAALESN